MKTKIITMILGMLLFFGCVALSVFLFANRNDNNKNVLWGIIVIVFGPLIDVAICMVICGGIEDIKETKELEDFVYDRKKDKK